MAEQRRSPIGDKKNAVGYGAWLEAPESFIGAAIGRNFCPIKADVNWVNLRHEGRVVLFFRDEKRPERPATSGGYWWAVVGGVGAMLREEYGVRNSFAGWKRKRPANFSEAGIAEEAAAAEGYRGRRQATDPARIVEEADWREHHLALCKSVIFDDPSPVQGQRDCILFNLWVSGYSTVEIAAHPESPLHRRDSVDQALRRILHKLWAHFGVDPKERQEAWLAKQGNRERHRERCRLRSAQRRAAAKAAKAASVVQEATSTQS